MSTEEAAHRYQHVRAQAQEHVQRNPMKALGVAAGVGAALGWLLKRRH